MKSSEPIKISLNDTGLIWLLVLLTLYVLSNKLYIVKVLYIARQDRVLKMSMLCNMNNMQFHSKFMLSFTTKPLVIKSFG